MKRNKDDRIYQGTSNWMAYVLCFQLLLVLILLLLLLRGQSTPADVLVPHAEPIGAAATHATSYWANSFLSLHSTWLPACANNVVLNRKAESEVIDARRWSVHTKLYHTNTNDRKVIGHIDDENSANPPMTPDQLWNQVLPLCNSPQALLKSLQLGTRSPLDSHRFASVKRNETGFDSFVDLSFFTPYKCNFRWFSQSDACSVLSSFQHVQFIGDSLIRHTSMGLTGIVSGDLRVGALPHGAPHDQSMQCQCDGSFSEAEVCRTGNIDWAQPSMQAEGYCMNVREFPFEYRSQFKNIGELTQYGEEICDPHDPSDHRPIFLFYSIGVHFQCRLEKTIPYAQPLLEQVRSLLARCNSLSPPRSVHVAFGGMNKQNEVYDVLYPHQRPEVVMKFDDDMESWLHDEYGDLNVHYMRFFNLSYGQPTSDGYHSLTDTNLLRAQYILNLMDLLK